MKGKKWKRIAAAAFAAIVTLCTPLSGPAQGVEEASLPVRTLTLDTRSYSMAPGNIYDFRAQVSGPGLNQEDVEVYSSRTGIASVSQIAGTNKYRITGLREGTCYVKAEINGVHASIRVDVENGVTQGGDSSRSVSIIPYESASEDEDSRPVRTLTLDTRSYDMAPGNIYDFRARLSGPGLNQENVRVYSSRTGIASVSRIAGTDKYRITGLREGTCYVKAEINGVHASIRVNVQNGVTQGGDSTRSISIIPYTSGETIPEQPEEMRAVWVPYMSLDMKGSSDKSEAAFQAKFDAIVARAKDAGMNTLIVHVRPFGDAMYPSELFPWSHLLTGTQGQDPGYDPLAYMVKATHDAGMEFHAWVNPLRIQITGNPPSLSADNPYTQWIDDASKPNWTMNFEGKKYYNPGVPEVRDYIVAGIEEIVRNYDVDGVQFDDYFYPTQGTSIDSVSYQASGSSLAQLDWRRDNINKLVSSVYSAIKAIDSSVVFGISPQANIQSDWNMGADVRTWSTQSGYLDYICPQIYFNFENTVMPFTETAQTWRNMVTNPNVKLYLGLALYKAGSDVDRGTWLKSDSIIADQIRLGRNINADGFMLYSWEYLAGSQTEKEMQNIKNVL